MKSSNATILMKGKCTNWNIFTEITKWLTTRQIIQEKISRVKSKMFFIETIVQQFVSRVVWVVDNCMELGLIQKVKFLCWRLDPCWWWDFYIMLPLCFPSSLSVVSPNRCPHGFTLQLHCMSMPLSSYHICCQPEQGYVSSCIQLKAFLASTFKEFLPFSVFPWFIFPPPLIPGYLHLASPQATPGDATTALLWNKKALVF